MVRFPTRIIHVNLACRESTPNARVAFGGIETQLKPNFVPAVYQNLEHPKMPKSAKSVKSASIRDSDDEHPPVPDQNVSIFSKIDPYGAF